MPNSGGEEELPATLFGNAEVDKNLYGSRPAYDVRDENPENTQGFAQTPPKVKQSCASSSFPSGPEQ